MSEVKLDMCKAGQTVFRIFYILEKSQEPFNDSCEGMEQYYPGRSQVVRALPGVMESSVMDCLVGAEGVEPPTSAV